MTNRRTYEIPFVGLRPGVHEFNYAVNDQFFEEFGVQDFRNASAQVKLLLEKNTGFMLLRFEVGGQTEVTCDRCNNDLPLQLFDEFSLTVKLVENPEEMNKEEADPDVYYIGRTESHLDVKNWIYEFVSLSIPMQKTCEWEAMDGPHCNPAARELLARMRPDTAAEGNPIWKGLEKFRSSEENESPISNNE